MEEAACISRSTWYVFGLSPLSQTYHIPHTKSKVTSTPDYEKILINVCQAP
jgi:hypothetical protein